MRSKFSIALIPIMAMLIVFVVMEWRFNFDYAIDYRDGDTYFTFSTTFAHLLIGAIFGYFTNLLLILIYRSKQRLLFWPVVAFTIAIIGMVLILPDSFGYSYAIMEGSADDMGDPSNKVIKYFKTFNFVSQFEGFIIGLLIVNLAFSHLLTKKN